MPSGTRKYSRTLHIDDGLAGQKAEHDSQGYDQQFLIVYGSDVKFLIAGPLVSPVGTRAVLTCEVLLTLGLVIPALRRLHPNPLWSARACLTRSHVCGCLSVCPYSTFIAFCIETTQPIKSNESKDSTNIVSTTQPTYVYIYIWRRLM